MRGNPSHRTGITSTKRPHFLRRLECIKKLKVRRLVANVSEIYHSLDVSTRAPVRLPQIVSPAQIPGPDGKDLVSCLYTISQTARDRFEIIEDVLRAAIPTFERLDFPPVAAGRITVAWQDRGFTRPFYANELSEGTLRFLWLATLLQSPGLPMVTLIDEPEVSLHPEMLRLLADLMREASDRTQLVVATHSDRFVRFLEPAEIVVCDRDDAGGMSVLRADEIDLTAWRRTIHSTNFGAWGALEDARDNADCYSGRGKDRSRVQTRPSELSPATARREHAEAGFRAAGWADTERGQTEAPG
jgi:predicted ATPase